MPLSPAEIRSAYRQGQAAAATRQTEPTAPFPPRSAALTRDSKVSLASLLTKHPWYDPSVPTWRNLEDLETPVTMFVTTQAVQLPLGTGHLLSSQFQLMRSSELRRNRLPSKSSQSSSTSQRTWPGPVSEMQVPKLFSQGVTSRVLLASPHLRGSRACPPFLPTLFTLLASQCSAIQYQSEFRCTSLYYSPVATKQITYRPQATPPLLMNSVLPGSSHKQNCSFLPGQLISQMLVHCLTKATPQCRPRPTGHNFNRL